MQMSEYKGQRFPKHPASTWPSLASILLFLSSLTLPTTACGDETDGRINHLVNEMSLAEKIGQTALRGEPSRAQGKLSDDLKKAVREGRIGGFLNVMEKSQVEELQRIATVESPHKIPLIFGRDVIHGFKTIFPIPLGMAATFDPDMAERAATVAAAEAS